MINMNIKNPSPLKYGESNSGESAGPRTSLAGDSVNVYNRGWYTSDCEVLGETCRPMFVLEKHMTVIRKGPTAPPVLEMYPFEEGRNVVNEEFTGTSDDVGKINTSFLGSRIHQSSNHDSLSTVPTSSISNTLGTSFDDQDISMFYSATKEILKAGDTVNVPIDITATGEDWEINDQIIIEHEYTDSFGSARKATSRLQITILSEAGGDYGSYWVDDGTGVFIQQDESHVVATIMSVTGNFPQAAITDSDLYEVFLVQKPPIFEVKFPKFSYRYKYKDGEYSVFGPWSEIAFIPGDFDYLPKKGYNLGMQNKVRTIKIKNWVPKNIPKDVVQVDILYKESNSPNIYTVSSHKKDDLPEGNSSLNHWNTAGSGDSTGNYTIKSELIHKVVASNQMLRPWDNVPRKALAQEITANRLIYANYVQNFDLKDINEEEVKAVFIPSIDSFDFSVDGINSNPGKAAKSLKSMRTYQLGVVYRDRYGRETPVLTSKSGSIKLEKEKAKLQNRLSVQLASNPPYWAESYTFYIKETANEYYNLAMDRWYDAEDGGIWLSFPSSERNKITDRTNLILKKQHDTFVFTDFDTIYKVLSIKDNAPTFIKTDNKYWGSLPMMLPPPGWGTGGKPGGWDSGMFYNTGLPLPNRMFLDIFAEYWDQSTLAELSNKNGAQIRIVQSQGSATGYNATTSDTTNKTRWYEISNITYIGSPPQTEQVEVGVGNPDMNGIYTSYTTTEVEIPGQQEQLVRISLEKAFGNDALFCEPLDQLSLARGLSIEARTKIVKDKSEFEGRFFVKVLRDANVELNIIQPQQEQDDQYQILFTKDLTYLNFAQPGIQDWSHKVIPASGTVASGGLDASNSNYIPVGVNTRTEQGVNAWSNTGINSSLYGINEGAVNPRIVSSLSKIHANSGGTYRIADGALDGKPTAIPLWPFGPGDAAIGAFNNSSTNAAISKLHHDDPLHTSATFTPYFPPFGGIYTIAGLNTKEKAHPYNSNPDDVNVNKGIQDWPSYVLGQYIPYSWLEDAPIPPPSSNLGPLGPPFDIHYGDSATGPYEDRHLDHVELYAELELKNSGLDQYYSPTPGSPPPGSASGNSFLAGANPYQVPAIWGDQSDFVNSSNYPIWNTGTIEKLREDWYELYYGKQYGWPFAGFDPSRWFIDKCGAAKGYSGNGIWDDGKNGFMDISFWGIGNTGIHDRTSSPESLFLKWNPNEVSFADAITTPGTQFRFKHDPDQVVYTITGSNINTDIYNYEAPQGTWAVTTKSQASQFEESPPDLATGIVTTTQVLQPAVHVTSGGSGIGYQHEPVWGGKYGPLAGGTAFISDLYSSKVEKTGGAMQNRRVRWTLSLDKIIGTEGSHKFHPLTNHVDADGVANVTRNRGRYTTDIPHVTAEKGGTPAGVYFYNLNSYWNSTNNTTNIVGDGDGKTEQPGYTDEGFNELFAAEIADAGNPIVAQDFYARNPNAYIGLHERGLNNTEIQIITPYRGEERDVPMSNNPAIWETEPLEDVGLDIYYAASPSYPVNLERYRHDNTVLEPDEEDAYGADWYDYSLRGDEVIKAGSVVQNMVGQTSPANSCPDCLDLPTVCHVQGDIIWLTESNSITASAFNLIDSLGNVQPAQLQNGDKIKITWQGEGSFYGVGRDDEYIECEIEEALSKTMYRLKKETHRYKRGLGYFNCWSYGTGVESNRVRDDYNAVTVDKGVKASMPLATPYEKERKDSGLIFSGIYNSTSGINETNQFIQAEPITKDLNPINGSIQKLFARDTDLITFCENKVFKILAKKDALFNAGGNSQLTSTANVLGQAMPFSGEYGISRNPESFASESYRIYFTDKTRSAVLRLSKDGLTPISDAGMKDWFKDNLLHATALIGSHDDREDQYNLTIETADHDGFEKAYTLSYTEARRGWVSFKSFIQQAGISYKNVYYTTPSSKYGMQETEDPWEVSYASLDNNGDVIKNPMGETWQHYLDLTIKRLIDSDTINTSSVTIDNGVGTIIKGMVVEGNGVPIDTTVVGINCSTLHCFVSLSSDCFLIKDNELTFTTARNSFYDNVGHYSMIKTLFNGAQGSVKRFKTLDYEGTQAKTLVEVNNYHKLYNENNAVTSVGQIYYDNYLKIGWHVENIETDLQEGKVPEFINKEGKWFNYIQGFEDAGIHDNVDTGEFSLQGLGYNTGSLPPDPEPEPPTPSWNCDGNYNCDDPGTGQGTYTSLTACQNNCFPPTWDCDFTTGTCGDPGGGNGFYNSLSACQNNCYGPSWDCDGYGLCSDPQNGSGQYASITICQSNCAVPNACDINLVSSTPSPHNNNSCTNGSHTANVISTQSGEYTLKYWSATTPGQISGGTFLQTSAAYPSGTTSLAMNLPPVFGSDYWYFTAVDGDFSGDGEFGGNGCELGYNIAIDLTCTYDPSGPCTNTFSGGGASLVDATNTACDNGSHAYQAVTSTSYWNIEYYAATTSGQVTGGTLYYADPTQYSSGQMSTALTLPQGNYYFIATDANGCDSTGNAGLGGQSFYIDCPSGFAFELQIRDTTVPSASDGAVRVVYAGTEIEATGFIYAWSNGAVTSEITGLGMGQVGVTLTDNNAVTYNAAGDPNHIPDDFVMTNIVNGCTDPTATNFNYPANTDDGSCII